MSKLIAVTGATGWVGGWVVKQLVNKGHRVNACYRSLEKTGFLKSLGNQVKLVHVDDVCNEDQLKKAFKNCYGVIHVANPMPFGSNLSEEEFIEKSKNGALSALRAAKHCECKRVVLTATMASICGTQMKTDPNHLWSEEDWNDEMGSTYSKAKTLSEQAAWEFAKAEGIELATIHPAMVLGPLIDGAEPQSTLKNFYETISSDEPCKGGCYGLCDVRDVADAHVAAMFKEEAAGQRYLVALPDQYAVLELCQLAKQIDPKLQVPSKNQDPKAPTVGRKPSTNNSKVLQLLGRDLVTDQRMIKDALSTFNKQ